MRRVILAIAGTAAALVLLLTFKTSTQSAAPALAPAAAGASPVPGRPSGATRTVTGRAWPTIYGPVQVRVTLSGGRVTAVTAVEYPTGTPRDQQINAFAIPALTAETLKAGNADIDAVSGATYTSQGYLGSLQSALDQASGGQASSGASPSSTGTPSGSTG